MLLHKEKAPFSSLFTQTVQVEIDDGLIRGGAEYVTDRKSEAPRREALLPFRGARAGKGRWSRVKTSSLISSPAPGRSDRRCCLRAATTTKSGESLLPGSVLNHRRNGEESGSV